MIPVRAGEDLNWEGLEAYLRKELSWLAGEFSVMQFPGGAANLTYRVRFGKTTLVVRRPPFGEVAKGAHDMKREFRVLSRLHLAYSRAPRAHLYCDDPAILGAHFVVMEYRVGVVVHDRIPPEIDVGPAAGRDIGFAVADALADLHRVLPESCGLEALGRPHGYLDRQITGWSERWTAVADDPESPIARLGASLSVSVPFTERAALIHNDFKVDNCQFSAGDPRIVTSVFDWDMATVGDPFADLGTLLNYWPSDDGLEVVSIPGLETLGLPSRQAFIERYIAATEFDITADELAWYEAFGSWKTAVSMQQLYYRHQRGDSTDERMADRGAKARVLAEQALELIAT